MQVELKATAGCKQRANFFFPEPEKQTKWFQQKEAATFHSTFCRSSRTEVFLCDATAVVTRLAENAHTHAHMHARTQMTRQPLPSQTSSRVVVFGTDGGKARPEVVSCMRAGAGRRYENGDMKKKKKQE